MAEDQDLKRVLWFVLGGARGGENRARMIHELSLRPMNLNQLAEKLGVDYRTVTHHAQVLRGNSLVVVQGEKYGAMYFLSPRLEVGMSSFREIVKSLRYRLVD
ncbi:MAG TPA: winged helix-turn-helix domain-containing protein [Nitrososphaerales archaeon]|nr:winged helix-turn-helix domain-containing protein [Nitrososphaerales archaeon]